MTSSAVAILLVAPAMTVLGGYLAAHFGGRARLLSSAALGVFWALVSTAGLLAVQRVPSLRVSSLRAPVWYYFAAPAIVLAGTILGGILRAARANET